MANKQSAKAIKQLHFGSMNCDNALRKHNDSSRSSPHSPGGCYPSVTMDDKIALTPKLDEDSMISIIGSETAPLEGVKMNVEEPIVVLGIEDKAGQLKESEMVCRDEEKKRNDMEEVGDEEDPEEEVTNDGNPKEEVNIDEDKEEDPEEDLGHDENWKDEVIIEHNNEDDPEEEENIEEDNEEDPEEEVGNDENRKEEVIMEEDYEDDPEEELKSEEDVTNYPRNEGKLESISKKKMSKLRKKTKMLKKKKIALRKKVKNALVCTSKLDGEGWVGNVATEMISLQVLDKNNTPNDVGNEVVASEQNDIVDDVDNGVAISNRLKMNAVVLGDEEKKAHEIVEVSNDKNTKGELQLEGDTRNVAKTIEKLEANSKKKARNLRQREKKKKKKKDLRDKKEVVVNDRENPESSKKKTTMNDKCMGMIFMCNSKTKKDCYNYQVFGLPASKKDIVFEIYEGMKLFLYDIDLKLMYGIYEAAGPGGYNIEPKAFNSAFPSQVRFSVLEDCLPLAEEKYKKTIEDNYYKKNKFDCQLNSKQVENLCKLFRDASKGLTSEQLNGSQRAEAPAFVDQGPKRPPRGRKGKGPTSVSKVLTSEQLNGIQQAETSASVDRATKWPPRGKKAKGPQAVAPAFVDQGPKRPPRGGKAKGPQAVAPAFVDRKSKQRRRRMKAASRPAGAPRPVDHEPKQPRGNKKPKIHRAEAPTFLGRKAKRPSRKAETYPFTDPMPKRLRRNPREETHDNLYGDSRHHGGEDERHHTIARNHLYSEDPMASRREVYESLLENPPLRQPLHLPLTSSLLASSEREVYRMELLQYRDVSRPMDVDHRRQDEFDPRDSYINPRHQDDFNQHGSYLASRGHWSYYDTSSSAGQPSDYYPPASGRPASTYRLSAAPPPDYRPYHPGYQYYPYA